MNTPPKSDSFESGWGNGAANGRHLKSGWKSMQAALTFFWYQTTASLTADAIYAAGLGPRVILGCEVSGQRRRKDTA